MMQSFGDKESKQDQNVIELSIEGMMCMKNCGTTVQNALRNIDGVLSADVTFETHSAHIVIAPNAPVTAQDLIDTVECIGFGAKLKKPKDPLVIELLVEGMMCQKNCGTTVENALRGLDGVKEAVVVFEKSLATVKLTNIDSSTLEECIDMIECVGFEASAYDPVKAKHIQEALKEKKKKQQQQKQL
jgi:Cu+-exporting ATPase